MKPLDKLKKLHAMSKSLNWAIEKVEAQEDKEVLVLYLNDVPEALLDICKELRKEEEKRNFESTTPYSPYRCPICMGIGTVLSSFYSFSFGISNTSVHETCRTCQGTGIVWG